jgi:hypothetical protein
MNFAESPSRIIYDYLMVSQTYTNSTFQALFLTEGQTQLQWLRGQGFNGSG